MRVPYFLVLVVLLVGIVSLANHSFTTVASGSVMLSGGLNQQLLHMYLFKQLKLTWVQFNVDSDASMS